MNDTDVLNGAPPMGATVNAAAIAMLEQHLAALKSGATNTCCVISVDHGGATVTNWAGPRLGDVFVGCATIQHKLMQQFTAPQAPQSRIMRVRP
jgi:hypothetical protein